MRSDTPSKATLPTHLTLKGVSLLARLPEPKRSDLRTIDVRRIITVSAVALPTVNKEHPYDQKCDERVPKRLRRSVVRRFTFRANKCANGRRNPAEDQYRK